MKELTRWRPSRLRPIGGTISKLLRVERPGGGDRDLHEGDRFPAGTVLALLDSEDYQRDRAVAAQRLAQAEAKLVSAQAEADSARKEYDRQRQALGAVSRSDLDSAKSKAETPAASVNTATREVDATKVQLDQADANLAYCHLKMPYPVRHGQQRRAGLAGPCCEAGCAG